MSIPLTESFSLIFFVYSDQLCNREFLVQMNEDEFRDKVQLGALS